MATFLVLLFIGFFGWVGWKVWQRNAPPPELRSAPYDPDVAGRASILRQRYDNPYWYSGTSGYSGSNELDDEIAHLHDPYENYGESRKKRHDRLWLIAQLRAHKRDLQRQWAEIQARTKAEEAKRQAMLPIWAEQERLAKLAQEQAAAQAAREAAEQAERERQAYREAIAKAASQAPKEAP